MIRLAFKVLAFLAAGLLLVVAIMMWNVSRLPDAIVDVGPDEDLAARLDALDRERIATRIGEAVRFPTVIYDDGGLDPAPFLALHAWLDETYPQARSVLEKETVNDLSLLYRWPGSRQCPAIGFITHLDVVPVPASTVDQWTHPPFAGIVADGFVWGRGAVDTKDSLIIVMEAIEGLAQRGFAPECDVYLLAGHDEEIGGREGAAATAALLRQRGVRFAWLLDEGDGFSANLDGSLNPPVASISISAQGYLTLKVTAVGEEGHSSDGIEDTAVTRLADALIALRDNPMPGRLDGVAEADVKARAAGAPFFEKALIANLWAFRPVVESLTEAYGAVPYLRSTMAATVIEGGEKENVLPKTASALVNVRLHPRDSIDDALAWARRQVNDEFVTIEQHGFADPPRAATDPEGPAFTAVAEAISAGVGRVRVVPAFGSGGSDVIHYSDLTDAALNFDGADYRPGKSDGIHGTDERLSVDFLAEAVLIFQLLIERHTPSDEIVSE